MTRATTRGAEIDMVVELMRTKFTVAPEAESLALDVFNELGLWPTFVNRKGKYLIAAFDALDKSTYDDLHRALTARGFEISD